MRCNALCFLRGTLGFGVIQDVGRTSFLRENIGRRFQRGKERGNERGRERERERKREDKLVKKSRAMQLKKNKNK
jgi:hypothetical protein